MKKIPTLFKRTFDGHKVVSISNEVTDGMEWVLEGEGIATLKIDGSCCAIIDGKFYKRFDAKPGRKIPAGAIPCCDPDPVTGHWPHWVPVTDDPADRWYKEAYENTAEKYGSEALTDATYEAIGPHFQGNPYKLNHDVMVPHGKVNLNYEVERSFEGIKRWLEDNNAEGIVFWKDGEPKCKIKATDFGIKWNGKGAENERNKA